MNYSNTPPRKEGWYWMKHKNGFETIRRVFYNRNDDLCFTTTDPQGRDCTRPVMSVPGVEWSGPIPSPDEIRTVGTGGMVFDGLREVKSGNTVTFPAWDYFISEPSECEVDNTDEDCTTCLYEPEWHGPKCLSHGFCKWKPDGSKRPKSYVGLISGQINRIGPCKNCPTWTSKVSPEPSE